MMDYAFVAFVDILGFSDMVHKDCNDPHQNFFNLNKLKRTIEVIGGRYKDFDIKILQFSDSIVISSKYEDEKFKGFIDVCGDLQSFLFVQGILCRGGVSLGRHHHSGNFVFSEGLVESYRIESTLAKTPRIVVSQDLIDLFSYKNYNISDASLLIDVDNTVFIDYFSFLDKSVVCRIVNEYCVNNKNKSISISEKIRWISVYASFSCGFVFNSSIRNIS